MIESTNVTHTKCSCPAEMWTSVSPCTVDDDPELLEDDWEDEEWVEGEGVTAPAAAEDPANTDAQRVSLSSESGEAAVTGWSSLAGGGGSGDCSGVGVVNATRSVRRTSQTIAAATSLAGPATPYLFSSTATRLVPTQYL